MALMVCVMFFYIYQCDFSFIGMPAALHSSRLSAVIIIIWAIICSFFKPIVRIKSCGISGGAYKRIIGLFIFAFIYSLFLTFFQDGGEGEYIYLTFINFFIFSTLPTIALLQIFERAEDFLYVLLWVGVIQTFCIWLCLLVPSFKLIVDLTFNKALEFDAFRDSYAGGIGCITAPGFLRYATGLFACLYFILSTGKIKYILLFIVFGITGAMVARTGVLVFFISSLIALLYFLSSRRLSTIATTLFIAVILLLSIGLIIGKNASFFEDRFGRLNYLLETGANDAFFSKYFDASDTYIPPINGETIIGTGLLSGVTHTGQRINVDGGYIRVYAALGLPIAIFFYLFIFWNLYRVSVVQRNKNQRFSLLFLFILILLGEFKEFYILNQYIILVFFVVSCLFYQGKMK